MEVVKRRAFAGKGFVARRVRLSVAGLALIATLGGGFAAGRLSAPAIQVRGRPGVAAQEESSRASDAAVHPAHFRPKWGGGGS